MEEYRIGAKEICVTELHHEVLLPWHSFRLRHPDLPAPEVLVLDHHNDVVRAFRDPSRRIPAGCWRDPDCLRTAVRELRHDEHFDWAVRSGLIVSCRILSQVFPAECASEHLHLVTDPAWPEENTLLNHPELARPLMDALLETAFLQDRFTAVPEHPYILDIDCDYFASEQGLAPEDDSFFRALAEHAEMITLSLESDWVKCLRLPGETRLTGPFIARCLLEKFRSYDF